MPVLSSDICVPIAAHAAFKEGGVLTMPTFLPGWNSVPLCLTMMFPAEHA